MAHATFTLPAHTALFFGYAPTRVFNGHRVTAEPRVFEKLPQFKRAGKIGTAARGTVTGLNLIDGLRKDGFLTVGSAGMRWFASDHLRTGFERFMYWGPNYRRDDRDLPVWLTADYAMTHTKELSQSVRGVPKWLLFVNAAETHAPYMAEIDLIHKMREIAAARNGKRLLGQSGIDLMPILHQAQIRALETLDRRLAALFESLEAPFDYLITADHGEAFGENGLWGHVVAEQCVMNVPIWEGTYD